MNHTSSYEQAEKFIKEAGQFRLGNLLTESAHPHTKELSYVTDKSISDGLGLMFDVDKDVLDRYRSWIATDAPARISAEVTDLVLAGGNIFFTGCGATGRLSILLDAMWRNFWSKQDAIPTKSDLQNRTFSIMAGGDFALIKSVEGFEDFTQFGAKQIEDTGVDKGDAVFAITEGGETSFVIGTAWQGLKKGARVYFMYNNPDDILCRDVIRSREVIEDDRIEKINATTGPMTIMGSTRMQATSIELLMMSTILEMVIRNVLAKIAPEQGKLDASVVPATFMAELEEMYATLSSKEMLDQIAGIVSNEETAYRAGFKSTYFADHLGIDVLTDTTERSPTFCTPAFRKWDDPKASESWTYLILPYQDSESAWNNLLQRAPRGLAWPDEEIGKLVTPEQAPRQCEIMKQIGTEEILRFRIGLNGLQHRPIVKGDAAVAIVTEDNRDALLNEGGFYRTQLEAAHKAGALTGLVYMGRKDELVGIREFLKTWDVPVKSVLFPVPESDLLLDGVARTGIKMLLNAASTCIMVRLGRVLGNCMVTLVPSNLKLIDRSTRFIMALTDLDYNGACHLLFESIDYVAPRMQAGQAYPPVVALSVMRYQKKLSPEDAEKFLDGSIPNGALCDPKK